MKNFTLGFLLAAILLGGSLLAYRHWTGKGAWTATKKQETLYHCPMHPTYISDKPGNCPICGMELVPIGLNKTVAPGQQSVSLPESKVPGYVPVIIPKERIESMGITLAEARRTELDQSIRTYGQVAFDETRIHHVHTKFEGFIENLYANYVGQYVHRGDPLFTIYSPDLYATENEYLLALKAKEQMSLLPQSDANFKIENIDLVGAARQRLALWDIGENEIREIERTRKPIRALTISSAVSGYVTVKMAQHGLKVSPADNLYDIVDISTVWVFADIYEVNLPLVNVGQPATVTSPYHPGRTWHGRITFINPTVDPATRTVKARLEFPNPNDALKPDMYTDIVIGGARGTGIAVPENAVITTGERNIVFVAREKGLFEPREVILGVRVRNLYEIKKGVSEGEKVVTGANFLLDSESRLKAAVSSGIPGK